ncbi:MAG: cytochrome c oxidase subunit II [Pseudomonadota bacterium]
MKQSVASSGASGAHSVAASLGLFGIGALLTGNAWADNYNMTQGVTEISQRVYDLHMLIFWICVVIGVGVFGMIFLSIYLHRKSRGAEAAQFHENTKVEIAWTVLPTLILVGMAVPATNVLTEMYDTGGEDMTIEVRGYQWKWQYKYLDDDFNQTFSFFSNMATSRDSIEGRSEKDDTYLLDVDKPLKIPTNRKVRFLVTAEDVIHAFWVPDFGIKRDAIPGIINDLWTVVPEPGVYRGQCTELCGKDHGFMPIVVEAVPEAEFDSWYGEQLAAATARKAALSKTFSEAELMAEGEQVYTTFCSSCHQPNGQGVPPVFPSLVGSDIVKGTKEGHIEIILNGVAGSAMQAFGKQLDAAQIAAVTHYERNSWGNAMADITQPADVVAVMESKAE